MTQVAGTTFLSTRPIGAGKEKQIDLLTVFDVLPRVVFPADAPGFAALRAAPVALAGAAAPNLAPRKKRY